MTLAQAAVGKRSAAGIPGASSVISAVDRAGPGASAFIGVAAMTVPRRDSTLLLPAAARAGGGRASGRSVATKVPLPMRART